MPDTAFKNRRDKFFQIRILLQNQTRSPGLFFFFLPWFFARHHRVGNCGSQCQSLVKRKGTIYSKAIQAYSNGGMSPFNPTPFKTPTNTHTHTHTPASPCQTRPAGDCISGGENKAAAHFSWFLPVTPARLDWSPTVPSTTGCLGELQSLIQNHVAPPHGPPARVLFLPHMISHCPHSPALSPSHTAACLFV